ncbi:MAG: branched-chain amino acid transport system ATP-binding protein [Frankiaceae bacterium]|jgi:branched-chain amino acid transport system ATP-binding protein|nr:branched-chain amino acid transport system ATP-binding protein [Frankiaceae bacterium]
MKPGLELRGVSAGYAGTTVLRDVSLTVPAGSVVALLGPNGAGKTTLLNVASGVLAADAGTVWLADADVTAEASYRRAARGLCHVPEGRGIFPSLTVRQNIALHVAPRDEQVAISLAVDAFPVLGRRLGQLAGTLSGGEQQMLALTAARVRRPEVVLLDEVSTGLAPQVIDEIFAFLASLAAAGASLLVVEQYVARALALADYVYILRNGGVAFVGEPAELTDESVFAAYLGTTTTVPVGA